MPLPLNAAHVQTLRGYVAQSEYPGEWQYPYVREVLELADRLAVYVVAARGELDEHQVKLLRKRDVQLLTAIGKHLIETSMSTDPGRSDANIRLSLGQAVLDARDAIRGALIEGGHMPERRQDHR